MDSIALGGNELETVKKLTQLLRQQKAWLAHADWTQGFSESEQRNLLAQRLLKLREEVVDRVHSNDDLMLAVNGLQEAYSELEQSLRLASLTLHDALMLLQGQKTTIYGDNARSGRSLGSA